MSQEHLLGQMTEAYSEISLLNRATGNGIEGKEFDQILTAIRNQCIRVYEEVEETHAAAIAGDKKELLDGAADIFVTASWLYELIHSAVGDVGDSLIEVCRNNALKYTTDFNEAQLWLAWHETEFDPKNPNETYYISNADVEGVTYYAVKRNSDNKFMKPPHHPKVHLQKFLYE